MLEKVRKEKKAGAVQCTFHLHGGLEFCKKNTYFVLEAWVKTGASVWPCPMHRPPEKRQLVPKVHLPTLKSSSKVQPANMVQLHHLPF